MMAAIARYITFGLLSLAALAGLTWRPPAALAAPEFTVVEVRLGSGGLLEAAPEKPLTPPVDASLAAALEAWRARTQAAYDQALTPAGDPFRPYPGVTDPDLVVSTFARPTVAPGLRLAELALAAVVVSDHAAASYALLEDAAGRTYLVGLGDGVGLEGGVVKAIEPDRLVMEAPTSDYQGQPAVRRLELPLRPAE